MYRVLLERAAEKDPSRLTSEIHDRIIAAMKVSGLVLPPTTSRRKDLKRSMSDGNFPG
jgi:hypothetical protein